MNSIINKNIADKIKNKLTEDQAIEWLCNTCGNYVCKDEACDLLKRFIEIGIEEGYING